MPHITQCPSCNGKIKYVSSRIGENFICSVCGFSFELPIPEEIKNPKRYNLPEEIEIHICNKLGLPIRIENVLILIERGYTAGPFFTNKGGIVKITKRMLEEEEKDWISSGGGDHRNFGLIGNLAISIPSEETIDRWAKSREANWNFLLEHEKKNWEDINELIFAMKSSNNYKIKPSTSILRLEDFVGNEKILYKIKAQARLDDREKLMIVISITMGMLIANYRNLPNKSLLMGLIVSFSIIAAIGLFLIHKKNVRKLNNRKLIKTDKTVSR